MPLTMVVKTETPPRPSAGYGRAARCNEESDYEEEMRCDEMKFETQPQARAIREQSLGNRERASRL